MAGKYDLAEPNFLLAVKVFKENKLINHPSYSTLLNNLGSLYLAMGNYDKAELFLLEATQTVYGQNASNYTTYINNLADVYLEEKKYAEAEALIVKAARIDKQNRGVTQAPNMGSHLRISGRIIKMWANFRKQSLPLMNPCRFAKII